MAAIDDEIASQPRAWRQAASIAATRAPVLPQSDESVALVGCGTSWWLAIAIAFLREGNCHNSVTDAQAASLFATTPARLQRYDHVVAISRSGTTTEVVRLAKEVCERRRSDGPRLLAVVEDEDTPLARIADDAIVLPSEGRDSVVQTVFATAHLAMWRAFLGEQIEPLAQAASAMLEENPPALTTFEQVVFLGNGSAYGLAQEAALKLREIAGFSVTAYPSLEVRHGAAGAFTGPSTLIWALGAQPTDLLDELAATGVTVLWRPQTDPLVEMIAVQRAAVVAARARGRDPGIPPHLVRSVQLAT